VPVQDVSAGRASSELTAQALRESNYSSGAGACVVRASGLGVPGLSVMAVEGRVTQGHRALSCSMPSTRALVCLPRRSAQVCTGI